MRALKIFGYSCLFMATVFGCIFIRELYRQVHTIGDWIINVNHRVKNIDLLQSQQNDGAKRLDRLGTTVASLSQDFDEAMKDADAHADALSHLDARLDKLEKNFAEVTVTTSDIAKRSQAAFDAAQSASIKADSTGVVSADAKDLAGASYQLVVYRELLGIIARVDVARAKIRAMQHDFERIRALGRDRRPLSADEAALLARLAAERATVSANVETYNQFSDRFGGEYMKFYGLPLKLEVKD